MALPSGYGGAGLSRETVSGISTLAGFSSLREVYAMASDAVKEARRRPSSDWQVALPRPPHPRPPLPVSFPALFSAGAG